MKVEMLATGAIDKALNSNNISYKNMYIGDKFKVIEIEKKDAKKLNNEFFENAWCKFSNGVGGSPCDIITVNNQVLIGWSNNKNDTYDTLLDYMKTELNVYNSGDICDFATGLAKANGITMSKLFKLYEG